MSRQTTLSSFLLAALFLSLAPAGAQFSQQGSKLVGAGAAGGSNQGFSVALSADGNTAIVGGQADSNLVGAAWIYTRSAGVWTQQGSKLVGNGGAGQQYQGISVALSADGNTAIVGGYLDSATGAAWVFTRSGSVWTQEGNKLVGTGGIGQQYQGTSVALSADGNTAMVGGLGDQANKGAAWVFTRSGGVWTQQGGKLVGSGAVGTAHQGTAVSLSADGNTAIVGGYSDNSETGAVWVFTRSGSVWTQQGDKLVGNDATFGAWQGIAVSLSADGNTAIVGGSQDAGGGGAAWVYARTDTVWTQQGSKLFGTDNAGIPAQGASVSLSSDGLMAIVGGPGDSSNTGAAWVFARVGRFWTQQGSKLVGTGAAAGNPQQGWSVALSGDGATALVGGYDDGFGAGAAWVFASTATGVRQPEHRPIGFGLSENYPNPFNPSTTISYSIPSASLVSLVVYDMLGREVSRLVQELKHAGEYVATWKADGVPSGVYFCRLVAGDRASTRRMVLMK